jgi:hypothetical protein
MLYISNASNGQQKHDYTFSANNLGIHTIDVRKKNLLAADTIKQCVNPFVTIYISQYSYTIFPPSI